MGLTISREFNRLFGDKEVNVVIVGLDGAGKTTMLYKLIDNELITTKPTVGFNVETFGYDNIFFTIWDIGGQDAFRTLWKEYYQISEGVIFVVDSNDRERLEEARDELDRLLKGDNFNESALLILANKQDLPNAMTSTEITEKLQLDRYLNRAWYIQATTATSGEGLYEGLEWLSNQID